MDIHSKKCEDCKQKGASQGLATERKRRWCAECAKNHAEATDITNKRCEDCNKVEARFGLAKVRAPDRAEPFAAARSLGIVDLGHLDHLSCSGRCARQEGKKCWCQECQKKHAGATVRPARLRGLSVSH